MEDPDVEPREIDGDEWVSQYGNSVRPYKGRAFKRRPANDYGLSVYFGRLAPEQIATEVDPLLRTLRGAGVRYALVGNLREAGFVVIHKPTPAHPTQHGSVKWPEVWDDDDVDEAFDSCFDEVVWWKEATHE